MVPQIFRQQSDGLGIRGQKLARDARPFDYCSVPRRVAGVDAWEDVALPGAAGAAALPGASMTSTDDAWYGAQKSVVPTAAMPLHLALPPTPHGIVRTASVAASMTSTDDA